MYKMKNTRSVSWIKAARKDFEKFPEDVQDDALSALTIAAEGGKSDNARLFKGVVKEACSKLCLNIAVMPTVSYMQ